MVKIANYVADFFFVWHSVLNFYGFLDGERYTLPIAFLNWDSPQLFFGLGFGSKRSISFSSQMHIFI